MTNFNAKVEADRVINWIREYMAKYGPNSPIVIGISGGKDSAAVAAASVAAVGSDRVLGILMPLGTQKDIRAAEDCCRFLKIRRMTYNIGPIYHDSWNRMRASGYKDFWEPNDIVRFNHPARIRMMILYLIANQIGGRVANTCNMSESYVGYDTKWGDQCGDFSPFQNYTASEIIQMGIVMGMPERAMKKAPADGMCGQTDEDRWGFPYEILDAYLRGAEIDPAIAAKIEEMHRRALHKLIIAMPSCPYFPEGSCSLCLPVPIADLQVSLAGQPKNFEGLPMESLIGSPLYEAAEVAATSADLVYDAEHNRYVRQG